MQCKLLIIFAFSSSFLMLLSCSKSLEPDILPWKFETVHHDTRYIFAHDLDGDAVDETIGVVPALDHFGSKRLLAYLWIETLEGRLIDQVNYPGIITHPLHFIDWNEDGYDDILVAHILNDSLFVSFVNHEGHKELEFFLTSGQPREEKKGEIAWDPAVQDFYLYDLNDDNREELITIVFTSYARYPRGVYIHSLPQGKLLSKLEIGAGLEKSLFADFDADGNPELLFSATAFNNGAVAGGFADTSSYILMVELSPDLIVTRSQTLAGAGSKALVFFADFDSAPSPEILLFYNGGSDAKTKGQLQTLDPVNWRVLRQRIMEEPIEEMQVIDLNRDLKPEIVAITERREELIVLDQDFDILKRRRIPGWLHRLNVIPDIDGDGIDDIIVAFGEQSVMLDSNLEDKALLPATEFTYRVERGYGQQPYLLATSRNRSKATVDTYLLQLSRNRFYLLNRYGHNTLKFLAATTMLVLIALLIRSHGRQRALQTALVNANQAMQARTWQLMAQRITHEIKNPLTSIMLTVQRLQNEYSRYDNYPRYKPYFERILERIDALRRLSRCFLKLMDVEHFKLEKINLIEFVKNLSERLAQELPPDIGFVSKLDCDELLISVDAEQLQIAIENLISNAVNAMPDGGTITLAAYLETELRLSKRQARDYAVIEVRDTGIGIPAKLRQRIFEPDFTQTDGGTGLGLTIVRKVVEGHEGHIEVESEKGVGSVFSIYIPASKEVQKS